MGKQGFNCLENVLRAKIYSFRVNFTNNAIEA